MNYPLTFAFKRIAIVSQIYVRDGGGATVAYVRQKFFKLREAVEVFTDEAQAQLLGKIGADRIIDFNARYQFTNAQGTGFGAMARRGLRSLWKAQYAIENVHGTSALEINEETAWVKFVDGLLEGIPVIGMFTGYFLNPAYLVSRPDGTVIARLTKKRSFLESRFTLTPSVPLSEDEQTHLIFGTIMLLLLERDRG
jgi:uncharacterized protein YxjI